MIQLAGSLNYIEEIGDNVTHCCVDHRFSGPLIGQKLEIVNGSHVRENADSNFEFLNQTNFWFEILYLYMNI
jgi:hypothetical protein